MSVDYVGAAIEIARESGERLADLFARGVCAEAKGRFDVVTEADRVAETVAVQRIRSTFPSHTVVAEEGSGYTDTSSIYRWFVDPLDGTKNFARGYPAFSVSIALACADQLIMGVVFDPLRDEMFSAELGGGAFRNDERVRVSRVNRLEQCLVATGFPSAARHRHSDAHAFHRVSMLTQGARRTGSSALDLAYVASGRLDAFWDIGLCSWDVAAGAVLVCEAGGRCSNLRGGRFALRSPDLLADNALVHEALVNAFTEALAAAP
jgi:myo-inositol-1(or 4)-monophosphatase